MDIVERQRMNQSHPQKNGARQIPVARAIVVVVIVGIWGAGAAAYIWFSGGSAQPSAPLTAPKLAITSTGKLFHLVQESSQVRFIIDEVLLGKPNTVTGSTNQVAGEIMVDFTHPENIQRGAIRVNVKTLATDNEFRNRALRGQILNATSPDFEFATFVPTQITGLPKAITLGQAMPLQLEGNLTVHGVSRQITFEATVTPVDQTRLEGTAKATLKYKDFNLAVPDAPGVANVSENVRLEIDFVAVPNV